MQRMLYLGTHGLYTLDLSFLQSYTYGSSVYIKIIAEEAQDADDPSRDSTGKWVLFTRLGNPAVGSRAKEQLCTGTPLGTYR